MPSSPRSSSLAVRSVTMCAAVAPVLASLFSIAFAQTWDPNNDPTWTSADGAATMTPNILGGSVTQTGGDISSTNLIELGGPSFGALYTLGGGTLTLGGIWVGRIGDPPSQFVQNGGTVTLSLLEITDSNGKYMINGGTTVVNHINFDYPGGTGSPGGGSLVLNGGTLRTSTVALGFGSGYVGRFYFNGGTLQADPTVASSSLGWIQLGTGSNSQIYTYVGQNGGQLDTNGTNQVIYTPLLHDPSYSGTDGGITKLGAGTLTLVADNTYTGPTTISAGTLQIGNGGATGSFLGNAVDNATLIVNRAGTWAYSGVISGTGNLVINGGGTLTFSGSSTYTGGTTVNSGLLQLTVGGSIGTLRGALTINSGATVETDAIDAFGFATGAKVDSITVNGGTINHTAAGDIGWGVAYTLSNGALLSSNGGTSDATAASMFAFGGPVGGNTSVNVTAGTNTIAGHIDLRGDTDNVNIVNTNVNFTVASGATLNVTAGISAHNLNNGNPVGLTKLGAGTMTFTGANTYTGPTILSAGTLLVSGSISGSTVTVNSTATLGGAGGTTGPVTVNSGGILSPGPAPGIGKLSTQGAVTFNAGATFALEINTTAATTDLLAITGNLSLATTNNVALSITDLTPASFGAGALTFISYTGTWNGGRFTYNGNVLNNGAILSLGQNLFLLDYDYQGHSVALVAVPEPTSQASLACGLSLVLGSTRHRRRA